MVNQDLGQDFHFGHSGMDSIAERRVRSNVLRITGVVAENGKNRTLVSSSDGQVTFRWRDSAHGNQQKLMTLALDEFLRRFLLHLLPPRFVRIRYYGFLAHRKRAALLPLCRRLMVRVKPPPSAFLLYTL